MKILVVKLSSLGDILHLFPAISDLRRRFPEAEIHWLVEPAFAEVAGWHVAVGKVIAVPLRAHKKAWWRLPALLGDLRRQLRAEHYDIVLDAQGLLKSALLARLTGMPVTGFAAGSAREPLAALFYRNTARVPDGLHVIDKNRRLVAGIFGAAESSQNQPNHSFPLPGGRLGWGLARRKGCVPTLSPALPLQGGGGISSNQLSELNQPADFGLAEFRRERMQAALPAALGEIAGQPYVVLLHGTTWNSKYWPEASWAELASLLARHGWRCVLPWGNEDERLRAQRLQAAGGGKATVLPRLSLAELMGVLLHARVFVSVESGIGHLAAALDVPGLMLHGPTDPDYSGILGKSCRHIVGGLDCSPCFKRDCPKLDGRQGDPPCQLAITAQQVFLQCQEMLDANAGELAQQAVKIHV